MGLWSSFLDFLWPVAAKKAEPEPLPPLDWPPYRMMDLNVMREVRQRTPDDPIPQMWEPWPVPQFDPNAEGKLRRITGSRGLRRGNSTKPRAVVDAAGVRHPSLRAAAKAHGMAPATLWDMLTEGRGGWRYADEGR